MEPLNLDFMECDTCRAKPGTPVLCAGCLHNRAALGKASMAFEVMMRRGWMAVKCPNGWMAAKPSGPNEWHWIGTIIIADNPFEALISADTWYRENHPE